jgi:alkanesulfonate monooxygenase SsuD/methylene tetrahydromethanopterin reductase-like flavin-dependent oxidoreductase (luciferase family)
MIDRAAAARDADLDSLFVGDHHVTGPGPYYQNVPILARMLAEWGDRPAGALFLLPLWHPVLLAEQIGTLASIHQGRFILQCAGGRDDFQFSALGVPTGQRPSRSEQSLEIMRRLWNGERVTHDGRWTFKDASIAPVPPEPVEVWLGAMKSAPLDRAARIADGWLASPGVTVQQAAAMSAEYLERCEAHGRLPQAVAIRRDVYVGASDEEAAATTAPILERGYRGMDPSALAIGGPETVAAHFAELAESGYTDVIVRNIVTDQDAALASIARLGEVRERVMEA